MAKRKKTSLSLDPDLVALVPRRIKLSAFVESAILERYGATPSATTSATPQADSNPLVPTGQRKSELSVHDRVEILVHNHPECQLAFAALVDIFTMGRESTVLAIAQNLTEFARQARRDADEDNKGDTRIILTPEAHGSPSGNRGPAKKHRGSAQDLPGGGKQTDGGDQ
jgi:hypothetical protein